MRCFKLQLPRCMRDAEVYGCSALRGSMQWDASARCWSSSLCNLSSIAKRAFYSYYVFKYTEHVSMILYQKHHQKKKKTNKNLKILGDLDPINVTDCLILSSIALIIFTDFKTDSVILPQNLPVMQFNCKHKNWTEGGKCGNLFWHHFTFWEKILRKTDQCLDSGKNTICISQVSFFVTQIGQH